MIKRRRVLATPSKKSSRLIVEAKAEDTIARPGNREKAYLVVSVTDEDGRSVTGLTKAHFRANSIIVGPGGSHVQITRVARASGIPSSFYILDIVPVRKYTWKPGRYIFGVIVTKGSSRGQALASFLLN